MSRKATLALSQISRRHSSREAWRAVKAARAKFAASKRAARRGLVHGPYVGAEAHCGLTYAVGGRCTKLRRKFGRSRCDRFRPPRGLVRTFSRKARTRLQQTLCAIPTRHIGQGMLFVTLTYPRAYPGDWRLWKSQLHNWRKRLFKRCPRASFVWKLEPQKRGAPHFHLIVTGVPYLAREWLSRSWYEVVGSSDEKHLVAGTNVQQIMSSRGVAAYAAKYTAKAQQLPADWQDGVGRWWGVYGRERLGIVWEFVPLTQPQFWTACRWTYRLLGSRYRARGRGPPRRYSAGLWVVLDDRGARALVAGIVPAEEPGGIARRALGQPLNEARREDAASATAHS